MQLNCYNHYKYINYEYDQYWNIKYYYTPNNNNNIFLVFFLILNIFITQSTKIIVEQ
jgi:hypothetical protein